MHGWLTVKCTSRNSDLTPVFRLLSTYTATRELWKSGCQSDSRTLPTTKSTSAQVKKHSNTASATTAQMIRVGSQNMKEQHFNTDPSHVTMKLQRIHLQCCMSSHVTVHAIPPIYFCAENESAKQARTLEKQIFRSSFKNSFVTSLPLRSSPASSTVVCGPVRPCSVLSSSGTTSSLYTTSDANTVHQAPQFPLLLLLVSIFATYRYATQ